MVGPMLVFKTARVLVCDCCRRAVDYVRTSQWHGEDALCRECFSQWYDPDNDTIDIADPKSIGNYVRKKHGLPPLDAPPPSQPLEVPHEGEGADNEN